MSSVAQTTFGNLNSVIREIISNTHIIEYGIVKEILDNGEIVVTSLTRGEDEYMGIFVCNLINSTSKNFSIKIKPEINDKVIVFFPRRFVDDVLKEDVIECISTKNYKAYLATGAVALLLGVNTGSVSCDVTDTEANFDFWGNIIKIKEDGSFSIKLDKTEISGNGGDGLQVIQENSKIKISNTGDILLESSGKIEIRNKLQSIKDILKDLSFNIQSIVTTGTEVTQAVSEVSKAQFEIWESKVEALFS